MIIIPLAVERKLSIQEKRVRRVEVWLYYSLAQASYWPRQNFWCEPVQLVCVIKIY